MIKKYQQIVITAIFVGLGRQDIELKRLFLTLKILVG